ncbi:MAG: hypothetical protein JWN44_3781 [Myxococcales bacterium]|nr:hypothetical protein [Myxococcales bacterium]
MPAFAHAFDPMLVEVAEAPDGRVDTRIHPPPSRQDDASFRAPELLFAPELLVATDRASGLAGRTISLRGLDDAHEAVLRVTLRDGRELTAVLHGDGDRLQIPALPGARTHGRLLYDYLVLGARHILGGPDHLLFLLGLVLLVRRPRRLLVAATAFSAAHSLTLALATLGALRLPAAPVEALIALSIVVVAVELTDGRADSATRRAPAVMAFGFGLVHGLGFAGALAEVGLTRGHSALALAAFNVGVECGQVAFVLLVLALLRLSEALLGPPLRRRLPRALPAYAIGSVGAAWLLERVAAFFALACLVTVATLAGCDTPAPYVESRAACADHNPQRNLYFGDLHVHTAYSFDAHMFDVRTTPDDAYRFARGAPVALPPLDADGNGTRTLQIDRPLDFAAVTDHSEFLGEVEACTTPGSAAYDTAPCVGFRAGGKPNVINFGVKLALDPTQHDADICGPDGRACEAPASAAWIRIQEAARGAYDTSAQCSFTALIGYEYSAATGFSTLHRNVIFRSDRVPTPVSYFDATSADELWQALDAACKKGLRGCDALAIPHNSNESNGNMFYVESSGDADADRARAERRAAWEPLVEIYQHKGDSECMNGLGGVIGEPDEACGFEKSRRDPLEDCGDGRGHGGASRLGCFSARDFVRGALLHGLAESQRIGVNPFRLGIIASSDTHNGTPGAVAEDRFVGHRGLDDDTPALQLGNGSLTPGGIEFSPGGLAAVWAEENSRPAIFDALRRREVYGTSGPRLAVRFFGGWALADDLCDRPDLVEAGYRDGVPMGGELPARAGGAAAPRFVVSALRDPGTTARPGVALQRVQIVKGWVANGELHEQLFDVAGDAHNGATVDETTCTPSGPGADTLCAVWRDPAFDGAQHAFYYARVLENPSCRWNSYICNALPASARPPACTDATVARTIQERAWTSPIWYTPAR